jgi:hypothetical protein
VEVADDFLNEELAVAVSEIPMESSPQDQENSNENGEGEDDDAVIFNFKNRNASNYVAAKNANKRKERKSEKFKRNLLMRRVQILPKRIYQSPY